jgi:hypothetical protein
MSRSKVTSNIYYKYFEKFVKYQKQDNDLMTSSSPVWVRQCTRPVQRWVRRHINFTMPFGDYTFPNDSANQDYQFSASV